MDGHLWHHLLPSMLGTLQSPDILFSPQSSYSGYSQRNNTPSSFQFHSLLYLHFKWHLHPSGTPPPANTSTRLQIIMNMWRAGHKKKSTIYMRKPKEMLQGKEELPSSVNPWVKSLDSRNLEEKFLFLFSLEMTSWGNGRGQSWWCSYAELFDPLQKNSTSAH